MTVHYLALYRGPRRAVLAVEDTDLGHVVDTISPFLAEDTMLAHADSNEQVVRLAMLRHEVQSTRYAYEMAIQAVAHMEAEMEVGDPASEVIESAHPEEGA